MKNRYIYLDLIRCLACFMVIIIHSMSGDNANPVLYVTLNTFAMPCNALFFMTSGALLLPVNSEGRLFLKKRLGKIVVPCILWTIIYNLTRIAWGDQNISEAFIKLKYLPFSAEGYGILWFIYVLIGLYFVAPIISPWLMSTRRENIKFVLILWGITLVFLIIRNYLYIPHNEDQMLYYFGGYLGYFLLGYYLHKYRPKVNMLLLIFLLLLPFFGGWVIRKPFFSGVDRWSVLGYLSLFTALCSLAWFLLVEKTTVLLRNIIKKQIVKRGIVMISNLTFGVYLMHIIVRNVLWHISFFKGHGCVVELSLTIMLTFVISLGLSYAISNLSFAQYIIGFKNKNE